uniref:cell division cycle and apoptosis regulator protein 1 n=1 Tax=Panthera onca TaxID=9690 RepID=UPI002953E580|nr:cell division cycle and apoptosis regulator protein 1 [Panthera onca]
MAQFGGQKNPPWATQFTATAVSQPAALGVQQPSLLGASPTIYTQQTALAAAGLTTQTPANYQLTQTAALQQQAAAAAAALQQQYSQPQQALYSVQQQLQQPQQTLLTQPAVALPTSLSLSTPQPAAQITVSYPTPRSSQQQTQPQKQRVFTGVVTKLHDTFGFVDEDVFFQLSAVKGKTPQVGDRVLVEATYNPNMPFKWNAQRIQTLPNQNQSQTQPLLKTPPAVLQPIAPQTTFGVQAQPQPQSLLQAQISAASITPLLQTQPQPLLQQPQQKAGLLQPPVRIVSQPQPARRLDPPSRFSGRNDRGDQVPNRKDDRSRERERERRRSRERSPQRKRSRERSPRRERERSPRRVRRVVPRYTVQFSKFSLDCPSCDMMELRRRYQNLYIPSDFFDAQFTWVDAFPLSRPFQLGNYCNFYVMHREVESLEKNMAVLDPPDADHLYSAKVMLMASPSMEDLYHKSCALAEDPQELRDGFQHPARLVKFLVGMKGKDEAMAIGGHWSPSLDGPDPEKDPSVLIKTAIRCCKALTGIDLSVCTQWYRFAEIRYHRPEETHKGRTVPAHVETVVLFFPDVWHCLPTRSEWETLSRGYKQQLVEKLQGERKEADGEQDEEEKDDGEAKEISTPTHWSKLDPKTMKVNDLRKELESRALSSKGLKSQLIARLTKQLKVEEQKEEQKELEKSEKEEEEEDDRKSEDDKEVYILFCCCSDFIDRDEEEINKRDDKRDVNRYCKERPSKDKEKEKTQMITINRDLLMAFVYFDQSHCGYLLEKDLEEILYTLGLHLSRAQVKKLLNKVVLRESCFYRKLTDTSKDEENHEESEALQEDMLGNRLLLPTPTVKQEPKDVEENVGLIVYNGAMVDVGSLLQKLEKSEKVRAEVEQKLQLLEEKTDEDEKTILNLENSNKSLSGELREVKKDFSQLQENLKITENMNLQFENQLSKTIRNLSTVMDEIHTVLKKDNVKNEDKDQKSKENGASV